jgi:hypothetical protein
MNDEHRGAGLCIEGSLQGIREKAPYATFSIYQSRDSDVWPSLVRVIPAETIEDTEYVECSGRLRMSGSGSFHFTMAVFRLMHHMMKDEAALGNRIPRPSKRKPLEALPYVERHLDEGHGFFGLEILTDGTVKLHARNPPKMELTEEQLAMLPERDQKYARESSVTLMMAPTTPYGRSYRYMPTLWRAIMKDNLKFGEFRGYHS